MGRPLIDLTGNRYGTLTVLEPVRQPDKQVKWKCKCDCGSVKDYFKSSLLSIQSCGCLARKKSAEVHTTHGKSKSRLFHVWMSMKQRCNNENAHAYEDYGGRGIKVCDEWVSDFEAFEKWALENGYDENAEGKSCTLDRIDVNGNYEPSNCRFISNGEQQGNKRNNVYVVYNGERATIAEWARRTGLTHSTIRCRLLRGWDVERTLTTPMRHIRTKKNHE